MNLRRNAFYRTSQTSFSGIFVLMKEYDYIIVGLGLAGIAFCEECERAGKTFYVFDKGLNGASSVAAGLYNPVILKRYTLPWMATEQFDRALPYFRELENKLGATLMHSMPVHKVFSSIEDQNNWFAASDNPALKRFISPNIKKNTSKLINAPYGYGEVLETGRIDIKTLQAKYAAYLEAQKIFAKAEFSHSDLTFTEAGVIYNTIKASRVVFAEGYGIKSNPFFKEVPLVGNKGEYIIVSAPGLKLDNAIKSSFFIVPLGDDMYKIGATYNWQEKDTEPSQEARLELIAKWEAMVETPYTLVEQEAGVRPTTGDRRALIGVHPEHEQLALLNGLGTRGVMAGPTLAFYLFEFLENGTAFPKEVDVMRFPKKFGRLTAKN